ncbi:Rne/Rng family ribonuclease [Brevibacillus sp. H7]|uniref:Rne/Rng family ribonuclease n=1 Tax=Brevibacillus sp. H7 TaxID=3349138 RepID=UPI003817C85B
MKKLLISVTGDRTRVVMWENGRVTELYNESEETEHQVGNVYRGRVVDVLASMQAAFVDIGLSKNAYLYVDDALSSNRQHGIKPNIRELVRSGEERYFQVIKEATGTKAPRVTTQVGLPGRCLVYLPQESQISVSRKMEDDRERTRLKQLAARLLKEGEGVIIRTQAAGTSEHQLEGELSYLRERWREAVEQGKRQKTPCLIYRDDDLIARTVRERLSDEVDELTVDHQPAFQRVKALVRALYPDFMDRLTYYQGKRPLFDQYGVDAEIDKALKRRVPLKSGGYLLIDHTDAMTVIDVNTGKFTGKGAAQLEETVTQTNLEASEEIARQLRLRDIGGIVIIDFIDMKARANQERVLERLRTETAKDRTPTHVLGMTHLGLVEMTRKKVRQNLAERLTEACPTCAGRGRVITVGELALRFEQEVASLAKSSGAEAIVAEVPPRLMERLATERERIESGLGVRIHLLMQEQLHLEEYRILYVGDAREALRRSPLIANKSLD